MKRSRQRIDPGKAKERVLECPECKAPMRLRGSKFGLFYGCTRWPECDATHGAHPSGEPLGIPATRETKRWRIKAHEAFDLLWKRPTGYMSRSDAYAWMTQIMGLPKEEAHIGRFTIEQCQALIEALNDEAWIATMKYAHKEKQ